MPGDVLISLGLDHRHVRLGVREHFHVDEDDAGRIARALAAAGASESALVRTCNRVEVYSWWEGVAGAGEAARRIAEAWVQGRPVEVGRLREAACLRRDREVVRHLFRVAAGLESQIVGDIHILGQVRRALRDGATAGSVGTRLRRLFETALHTGKQIQRRTRLLETRRSVGAEAARRAARGLGSLAGRDCVVVGCGKSGTQAARTLVRLGADRLTLLNRTPERARSLARALGGACSGGLAGLAHRVARADLVIVATGAAEPVLSRAALAGARAARASAGPLVLVDVAVPRNVEAEVRWLPGVEVVDLDGLESGGADSSDHELAVQRAEQLVDESLRDFDQWLALGPARDALQPFREVLTAACRREIGHAAAADASTEHTVERIVARVMAHPMTALRAACERGEDRAQTLSLLGDLFGATASEEPRLLARARPTRMGS